MKHLKERLDFEEDLFHEDHAIDFVMWLAEIEPDCLHQHLNDADGGRQAFTDYYNDFKNMNK